MTPAPPPRARSRAARIAAAVAVLCLLLALGYWASTLRSRTVFKRESAFGPVWVTERADGLRSLYMGEGRARQSAAFPRRPGHLELAYTRVATVGLALAPEDGRILFVGLGGGAMPMYARQVMPDAQIEVVEIDPLVVDVARRFFSVRPGPRLAVHTADGRAFIEQAPPGSYDLVVLDAFSDDEIPLALATRQFLEAVRAALAPDGVVVSNLWSSSGKYEPMLATYRVVFEQVHLIRVGGRAQRILVAGPASRPLDRSALVDASRALVRWAEVGFDLPTLVEQGYEGSPDVHVPILEDSEDAGASSTRPKLPINPPLHRAPAPARRTGARAAPARASISPRIPKAAGSSGVPLRVKWRMVRNTQHHHQRA